MSGLLARRGRGVGADDQIPRLAMLWLLVAVVVVVVPHVRHLPMAVVAIVAGCVLWRIATWRGQIGHPRTWLKALLIPFGLAAVLIGHMTLIGVEPAVAVLVIAFALKVLEMASRRDALVVIFLGYFVAATQFLFSQTLPATAWQVVTLTVITAALVAMQRTGGDRPPPPLQYLRHAAVLVAQSLPMAVLVFLLFPRIGPLWSVPSPTADVTGISDRVTPGDIAELGQSAELAFRVTFDDAVPAPREMYWRGIVFSQFHRGTWSQARPPQVDEPLVIGPGPRMATTAWRAAAQGGRVVGYTVALEPTQQPWLFALDVPFAFERGALLARDWRLIATAPVVQRTRYNVRSWLDARFDVELPDWLRAQETRIDREDHPRTVGLAARLRAATGDDDAALVERALAHFRDDGFLYTLSPPELPRERSIDAFLFDSRRGFCAHYAGAFVMLMRAAGIPARMIGGYQGGDYDAVDGFLTVRQYDAHAWVEVWLDGRGWQRVDPTAVVAPDRLSLGVNGLADADLGEVGFLSGVRLRRIGVVGDVLAAIDRLEFRWNLLVVGYDARVQLTTLQRWFGAVDLVRMAIGMGIAVVGATVVLAAWLAWRAPRRRAGVALRTWRRLARIGRLLGCPPRPGEAPLAWARRLRDRPEPLAAVLAGHAERLADGLYGATAGQGALAGWRRGLIGLEVRARLGTRPAPDRPGQPA